MTRVARASGRTAADTGIEPDHRRGDGGDAQKAAKGENVGKMFITDPTSSEYELYQQAKAEREAKEAHDATAANVKAIKEAAAAASAKAEAK